MLAADGRSRTSAAGAATLDPPSRAYVAGVTPRWEGRIADEMSKDISIEMSSNIEGINHNSAKGWWDDE